jgi:hypothetical protein
MRSMQEQMHSYQQRVSARELEKLALAAELEVLRQQHQALQEERDVLQQEREREKLALAAELEMLQHKQVPKKKNLTLSTDTSNFAANFAAANTLNYPTAAAPRAGGKRAK